MYVKNAPKEFVDWLKKEMKSQNVGVREIALKVGVSHPTISDIVTNEKKPSFDTVLALAEYFKKSPVVLLRMSGLLPPEPDLSPQVEDMRNIMAHLSVSDQEELIKIGKMKLENEEQKQSVKNNG